MNTYRELDDAVIAAQGLLQVTVELLRDLEGAGKLGTHVRADIRRNLRACHLHTLERQIPNDQRAHVWLVSTKTPLGEMFWEVVQEIRRTDRRAA